ncbi:MAG TPA: hypothetical protein VFM88_03735 [Vicinamibacteria bacterium]|nr:hypothetical protein [Vicinamibacteria bacterium]
MAVVAQRARRLPLIVAAGLLLYAAVLALSPALHHDFQCHAQHPGHCDACRASAVALGTTAPALAATPLPEDEAALAPRDQDPREAKHRGRDSGRAPPPSL